MSRIGHLHDGVIYYSFRVLLSGKLSLSLYKSHWDYQVMENKVQSGSWGSRNRGYLVNVDE